MPLLSYIRNQSKSKRTHYFRSEPPNVAQRILPLPSILELNAQHALVNLEPPRQRQRMLVEARLSHDPNRGLEIKRWLAILRRCFASRFSYKGVESVVVAQLSDAVEQQSSVSAVGEFAIVQLFEIGE